MLTAKRHALIIDLLKQKHLVTIQELVDLTSASESTIRRDLRELESHQQLIRVHGGATSKHSAFQELTYPEKSIYHVDAKKQIAKFAASLIEDHDCIYLDAGTTNYEMISHLANRQITVVTNGLTHLDALNQFNIKSYLLGGAVKHTTRALIGVGALKALEHYHFDKVFIGANAIDLNFGYSTPDPEEAAVKRAAIAQGELSFVIADHSKLNERRFAKIVDLNQATLITDAITQSQRKKFQEKTTIKVVTT